MLKYRLTLVAYNVILILVSSFVMNCSFHTQGDPIPQDMASKKVLLVLDMQKDFILPQGALPIESTQAKGLMEFVASRISEYENQGNEVVFVVNEFSPNDFIGNWFRNSAAIQGSEGAELMEGLNHKEHPVYTKSAPDAFGNDEFDAYLRSLKVTDIEIVGVYADQCVSSTVRGGLNRGYSFHTHKKGLGANDEESVDQAIVEMKEFGVSVVE